MLRMTRNLWVAILLTTGMTAMLPTQAAAPLPKSRVVAGQLLENIDMATWIAEGSGKRIVYIFFDPNCPYCHKLYQHLRPLVGKQDLQFRWIPVDLLAASSLGKAAAILQASNSLKAFHYNEDNYDFNVDSPGGGIVPAAHITDKTKLDLSANLSILQGQNVYSVPVTVFRANDGAGFMFQGTPPAKMLLQLLQHVQ